MWKQDVDEGLKIALFRRFSPFHPGKLAGFAERPAAGKFHRRTKRFFLRAKAFTHEPAGYEQGPFACSRGKLLEEGICFHGCAFLKEEKRICQSGSPLTGY
jgi:hypothetical protein